jgi:hypothetical protein
MEDAQAPEYDASRDIRTSIGKRFIDEPEQSCVNASALCVYLYGWHQLHLSL